MENGSTNPSSRAGQPGQARPGKAIVPSLVLVVCLLAFLIKAVTSMVQESATWDETSYLGLGKYLLQTHHWDVAGAKLHPPLSYYIHDIPLWFFPMEQAAWTNSPAGTNSESFDVSILRGQALLSSPANQGDRLLTWSRLTMVLTALLLGWFVYRWSYALYGKWSAMLAIILYSFSPNILAHARLITPDITLTTFTFVTLYYFWRLLKDNRPGDAVVGGICLGLALLSKFTSVLLFPIGLLLMAMWGTRNKTWNLRYCLLFAAIGIGILFLGYGMNPGPYFDGIRYQLTKAEHHESFLLGNFSITGWWYYFIVAFVLKTPIATMIFLAVALALFAGKLRKGEWLNELFLLVPAAVIFVFFSLNHQSIGLRYILPIYPLLFVFASMAAPWLWSRKLRAGLAVAVVGWYIGASCYIHPCYLAYFNEFAGGPDNGYKYLVDSNLDWGQDLKGLKNYMQQNGIARINLSYFGSDSPTRYGISYNWLPSWVLLPSPEEHEATPWFAISATDLQGVYTGDACAWFRGRKPDAKIGYSIFIYRVRD